MESPVANLRAAFAYGHFSSVKKLLSVSVFSAFLVMFVLALLPRVQANDVGPTLFETNRHIGPNSGTCQTNGPWSNPEDACRTEVQYNAPCNNYAGFVPSTENPGSFACLCHSNPGAACGHAEPLCPPGRGIGGHSHPEFADLQLYASPIDGICALVGPDPLKNSGKCSSDVSPGTLAGNPIHAATGNKYQEESDYIGIGPYPLRFSRYYNSDGLFRPGSTIDRNWRGYFDRTLDLSDGPVIQTVSVYRHTGKAYYFIQNAAGWISEPDVRFRLWQTNNASGTLIGWRLETEEGEVEFYDAEGRLTSILALDGFSLDLLYGGDGRLSHVRDSNERVIEFDFGSDGRLALLRLPDGETIEYSYDAGGRLVGVDYPGSAYREYLYENSMFPRLLTGIVDESGARRASWEYDALGRAVLSVSGTPSSFSGRVEVTYLSSTQSRVRRYTSETAFVDSTLQFGVSFGTIRLLSADQPCQSCGPSIMSRSYDSNGFLDEEVDRLGTVTDHDFDSRGRETKRIAAKSRSGNTDLPERRTTETDWHSAFRLPVERRTLNASNALVARQKWSINSRGQISASCDIDVSIPSAGTYTCGASTNAPAGVRQTRTTYCEAADVAAANSTCPILGLVKSVDGPRTDVDDITTYTYYPADAANCAASPSTCSYRKGDLWKVTNAKAQVTEFLAYDGAGRLLRQTDANNLVTDLEYHPRGWVSRRIVRGSDPDSELDDAITRIDYFPTGLVQRVTQPDGAYTDYTYDAAHRLTEISDGLGHRIHYTLDAAGNRIKEETFDPSQTLTREVTRAYNALGQLQSIVDGNQQTVATYTYDANGDVDTSIDALGRVHDQTLDPLGRLIASISNLNGSGHERAETGYGYDALDRLRKVTDPNGLTTSYTYNSLGDLLSLISPDTGTTHFTVDAAGNRKTQTDARGVTVTYAYDELNRLTAMAPPTAAQQVTFDYDVPTPTCLAGETFGKGRAARMTDESGNTRYCYDSRGQMVRRVQFASNGPTFTVLSSYTAAGRLDTLTYPSGATVRYMRDKQGRSSGVMGKPTASTNEISLLSNATYLPFGPLDSLTFGNGRTHSRSFDLNYGIDQVADSGAANDSFSIDFQLDEMGNVVAFDEAQGANSVLRAVDYDGQNRLTALKAGVQVIEGFDYDATGNRTQRSDPNSTTPYTTAVGSHRLEAVGTRARTYDAAGNTTAIDAYSRSNKWSLTYGELGRLHQVALNSTLRATYRYNGRGERIAKLHPTEVKENLYFVYSEDGKLLGEYYNDGSRVAEYVWLDDTLVAIYADHDGSNHQYVQTDHLGTPRAVVHPGRDRIVWRWDLAGSAFGDHAPASDPDGDGKAYVMNLRYPGQYFDAESGLHYNYFRDYDPSTGRYIESDPIGLDGGLTTFGYANGNALNFSDPFGLFTLGWNPGIRCGYSPGGFSCAGGPPIEPPPSCEKECKNPVTIQTGGAVCPQWDATCPIAMRAAGIEGPYGPTYETFDGNCLAKWGVVKSASPFVSNAATRAGASMLGMSTSSGFIAAITGPAATAVALTLGAGYVWHECKCSK